MKISNMIHAVDLHACGEPGRVIVGGVLDVPGETMFDKMQHCLLYTSPSPRDATLSRMPSTA